MITIAEVPEYTPLCGKLLTVTERQDVLNYLAAHPKAGDLIEGTAAFANCDGVEAVEVRAEALD